jgi:hypothetical protein
MIHTKVAKVLNPTSVILASGWEDGVKDGMEFVIYSLSETIRDPETGEDLGQLEIVKGRVYAVHVQDKLTWAQTKSRVVERATNPYAELMQKEYSGYLASILGTSRTVKETVYEQLKVAGAEPIEMDRTVRAGDRARSVYQPEFALTETT